MDSGIILQEQSASSSLMVFRLGEREMVLGRSLISDLVVNDPSVSRKHARLAASGPSVKVIDLNSRNGTFLNGKRIRQGLAKAGQSVRFGDAVFKVMIADSKQGGSEEPTDPVSDNVPTLEFRHSQLSVAQKEVFAYAQKGLSEKQIAAKLCVSFHTVHNHFREIYRVFEVHSRSELLSKVVRIQGDSWAG
jgi:pSer/pThr/pTyr-binding forkhead associated (FHA) protein